MQPAAQCCCCAQKKRFDQWHHTMACPSIRACPAKLSRHVQHLHAAIAANGSQPCVPNTMVTAQDCANSKAPSRLACSIAVKLKATLQQHHVHAEAISGPAADTQNIQHPCLCAVEAVQSFYQQPRLAKTNPCPWPPPEAAELQNTSKSKTRLLAFLAYTCHVHHLLLVFSLLALRTCSLEL